MLHLLPRRCDTAHIGLNSAGRPAALSLFGLNSTSVLCFLFCSLMLCSSCLPHVDKERRAHIAAVHPIPPTNIFSLHASQREFLRSNLGLSIIVRSLMSSRPIINSVGRVRNANFGYNSGECYCCLNRWRGESRFTAYFLGIINQGSGSVDASTLWKDARIEIGQQIINVAGNQYPEGERE